MPAQKQKEKVRYKRKKTASKAPSRESRGENARLTKKPPKKKRAGRPKIGKAKMDAVCEAISRGTSDTKACYYAGISPGTLTRYRAIAKEQRKNGLKATYEIKFIERLELAEEELVSKFEERIFDHSRFDWRAAAFMLQALRPEKYGRRGNTSVNVSRGGADSPGSNDPLTGGSGEVNINITVTEPVDVDDPPFK